MKGVVAGIGMEKGVVGMEKGVVAGMEKGVVVGNVTILKKNGERSK